MADNDARTPGTVPWWLARLNKRMNDERSTLEMLDNYYRGKHRLAFASDKFREVFGGLFSVFADNFCPIVVQAACERLRVNGFRWGESTTSDTDAWQIWQANSLDAESELGHTEALIHGRSFALVQPVADGLPEITIESATQMVVEYAPGSRRTPAAALKKWHAEDDRLHAVLYLPDRVVRYQTRQKVAEIQHSVDAAQWEPRQVDGKTEAENPLGMVPVVRLPNRPRLFGDESEIAQVIPVQNAVNKLQADMLIAAEYGAFRQRYVVGWSPEPNPETGEVINPFTSDKKVWTLSKEGSSFGEFEQTDLENYIKAIETEVQHIAVQTRTPPHYLFLRGELPSGETLRAAEAGLVAKVRDKQLHFGEAWEQVMRLAFLAMGDKEKAREVKAETIWADPETQNEATHIDALVKMGAFGVPEEILWEKAGLSQTEIRRIKEMQAAEEEVTPDADLGTPVG